ncbi:MAG: hypothetical protein KF726_00915 [Anaerolineae bacterium]|nr:hypothetical protein [Anaerolineae bacterium]
MNKSKSRLLASTLVTLLLMLLTLPLNVRAQSIDLEWRRWDAQITVQPNNVFNIVETQSIHILSGTIRRGARIWTADVDIQGVRVVSSGSSTPQALQENNSEQPGTYSVSNSGGRITLNYVLPQPQQADGQFTVQITYVAQSPTDGMVDWRIVPGEHDFSVLSSTGRIIFPSGEQPDTSLIRSNIADVDVSANGSELILTTRSAIPAGQSFSVQIPYGEGVGAAGDGSTVGGGDTGSGDNGSGSGGVIPGVPTGGDGTSGTLELPGFGVLALLCCGAVVLVLLGGGGLLSGLLRTFLGGGLSGGIGGNSSRPTGGLGGLGGLFGDRRSSGRSSNPFGSSDSDSSSSGSGSGRGFRRSADQDRNIGRTGNDKDSGGGASFS